MKAKTGNSFQVIGTATKDAELKYIGENNTPKASVSLAINLYGEPAEYIDIDAFGRLSEYAKTIRKGDIVSANGAHNVREYNGKTYHSINCAWLNIIPMGPASTPPVPDGFEEIPNDGQLPF